MGKIRKSALGYGPMEFTMLFTWMILLYIVQLGLYTVYLGYTVSWYLILFYIITGAVITGFTNVFMGRFMMAYRESSRIAYEDGILSVSEKSVLRNKKIINFILSISIAGGLIFSAYVLEFFFILPDHGYRYIWGLIPVWTISIVIYILYAILSVFLQLRVTARFDKTLALTPTTYSRRTLAQQSISKGSKRLIKPRSLSLRRA
jgi:hypothetical protein